MSAQKVATCVGLVAFVTLLYGVGAPVLLPLDPVPEIRIVEPAAIPADEGADHEAGPAAPAPSGGDDGAGDDGDDDDGGGDDSDDDDGDEDSGDD